MTLRDNAIRVAASQMRWRVGKEDKKIMPQKQSMKPTKSMNKKLVQVMNGQAKHAPKEKTLLQILKKKAKKC